MQFGEARSINTYRGYKIRVVLGEFLLLGIYCLNCTKVDDNLNLYIRNRKYQLLTPVVQNNEFVWAGREF